MKLVIRNILGILAGLVAGSLVNMGLVMLGPSIIPPPAGVDVTDPESLSASMHLFEARHFITPFAAHALGTLVGAGVAYLVAGSLRTVMSYIVGAAFLAGGIWASTMFPAPAWFIATDLLLAYFPMAWLGARLADRLTAASHSGS